MPGTMYTAILWWIPSYLLQTLWQTENKSYFIHLASLRNQDNYPQILALHFMKKKTVSHVAALIFLRSLLHARFLGNAKNS